MYKTLSILILSVVILTSCKKIVEIDLPKRDDKPVVNCMFQEGKPFIVNISLPKDVFDTSAVRYIENATVEISVQNKPAVILQYTDNGNYTTESLVPETGIEYFLKIKIPGYREITAKGRMPAASAKIIEVELKSGIISLPVTGLGDNAEMQVHNFFVKIEYDKAVSNYMGVASIRQYNEQNYNFDTGLYENETQHVIGYLSSDDLPFRSEGLEQFDNHELLLFKDILFQSQPEKLNFYLSKSRESKIWLQFYQFSAEAYKYSKSWIIHDYTKDYDFWEIYEPLPLYSNIENGYGIFAGYSMYSTEVFPDSVIILRH